MSTLVNRSFEQPSWSFGQKPLAFSDTAHLLMPVPAYANSFRPILSAPTDQPLMPILGMVLDVPTLWLKKSKFQDFFQEVHEDVNLQSRC